jgi:hypothetical protein
VDIDIECQSLLASWVRWSFECEYPQGKRIIMSKARQLARESGRSFKTDDGLPSQKWWLSFLHRHSLSLRVGRSTTAMPPTRAKVERFFERLHALHALHNYSAEQVWNGDESGYQRFKPEGSRVCVDAAMRRKDAPRRIGRTVREHITLFACVNANGVPAPPCWITAAATTDGFARMLPGTPDNTHLFATGTPSDPLALRLLHAYCPHCRCVASFLPSFLPRVIDTLYSERVDRFRVFS